MPVMFGGPDIIGIIVLFQNYTHWIVRNNIELSSFIVHTFKYYLQYILVVTKTACKDLKTTYMCCSCFFYIHRTPNQIPRLISCLPDSSLLIAANLQCFFVVVFFAEVNLHGSAAVCVALHDSVFRTACAHNMKKKAIHCSLCMLLLTFLNKGTVNLLQLTGKVVW